MHLQGKICHLVSEKRKSDESLPMSNDQDDDIHLELIKENDLNLTKDEKINKLILNCVRNFQTKLVSDESLLMSNQLVV